MQGHRRHSNRANVLTKELLHELRGRLREKGTSGKVGNRGGRGAVYMINLKQHERERGAPGKAAQIIGES